MLRLWDVASPGRPVMIGHAVSISPSSAVYTVAFSPDGRMLASSDVNGDALLWKMTAGTGQAVYTGFVNTGSLVYGIAFSPNSQELATGSADGTVRVWNVTTPAAAQLLLSPLTGHASFVYTLAFDGATLFSGGADGLVRVWGLPRTVLTGSPGGIASVAYSPDGRVLASAGNGGVIRLWDVSNPAAPLALGEPLTGSSSGSEVDTVAFSPNRRLLASGAYDNSVRLLDVTNPADPRAVGRPWVANTGTGATAGVYSVAFSPNGGLLATGTGDHRFQLWGTCQTLLLPGAWGSLWWPAPVWPRS
jgi:WD40 repeat protein